MNALKHTLATCIIIVLIFAGCSTEKNTSVTRTYHNVTTRYNVLFNGRESFKKGLKSAEDQYQDNYSRMLSVYNYGEEEFANSLTSDMDRALKKGAKVINFHSITAKPESKKGVVKERQREFYRKNEYNELMDENYLIMGKAHYFKRDYFLAIETFRFIFAEFPDEKETILKANLWLSRTFIELGSYRNALETLEKIEDVPKKLLGDYYATYAHLYLEQEQYEKAKEYLEKTLENTRKKRIKTRYIYILAQINKKLGNEEEAYKLYGQVIKMNPEYDMAFNAKINQALSFYGEGGKDILNELNKMLKDDKNIDYKDQIYYAIANIYFKRNDIEKALEYYKLSAWNTSENYFQQSISYLAIADIYYDQKSFENAQAYYDSAVSNLDADYPGYEIILGKSLSLTQLVGNLKEYKLQDSLQALAKLDDKTLNAKIDKIIQDVIKQEQEEKQREQERLTALSYADNLTNENRNLNQNTTGGQWYFYNLNAKGLGQNEFKLRWGNRALEDNWRRKNKTSVLTGEFATTEAAEDTTGKSKKLDKKSREYYLQDIPKNDSMLQASHLLLKESLYNAGTIYKNDLEDYDQAKALFDELIQRYPNDDYALLSYYALYSISKEDGDNAKRDYYKNLIMSKFPESLHAKIMSDPDYVKEYEKMQNEIDHLYEKAFADYERGLYSSVKQDYRYALSEDKKHKLIPKFEYLNILASKPEKNSIEFRQDLEQYIKKYPSESQTDQAKRILALMDKGIATTVASEEEAEQEIYFYVPDEEHIVLMGVKTLKEHNQLTFNIINFNLDNFDKLKLTADKKEVGDYKITLINKFKNKDEAEVYFKQLVLDKNVFKDVNETEVIKVVISKSNLETLYKDKSLPRYERFYIRNYR